MSKQDKWLLPEGIEEVLPPAAWRLECARRELLDMFATWGYELVIPPFIEYLESLLTGTGNDLDLQTFKLTDQLTGRMMGVRADITPQAARIDAHPLKREAPSRLCYVGTVLRTRSDGFGASRSPLQVGAELFGHGGIESDIEILGLVLETLSLLAIEDVHVDLGHVGIFRGLAGEAGLDARQGPIDLGQLAFARPLQGLDHLVVLALHRLLREVRGQRGVAAQRFLVDAGQFSQQLLASGQQLLADLVVGLHKGPFRIPGYRSGPEMG